MEMMDRAVTVPNIEAIGRRERRGDPGLGIANGAPPRLAFGKQGYDRGRQRASGAMGIVRGDAWRRQREAAVGAEEIVDALRALPVAALDQYRRTAHGEQPLALFRDRGFVRCDRLVQQGGGL